MTRLLPFLFLFGCLSNDKKQVTNNPPPPVPSQAPKEDNQWFDKPAGKWWIKGSGLVTWEDAVEACGGEFKVPTANELRLAWSRGLCRPKADEEEACPKAWAASITTSEAITVDLATGQSSVTKKRDEAAVSYCIQI